MTKCREINLEAPLIIFSPNTLKYNGDTKMNINFSKYFLVISLFLGPIFTSTGLIYAGELHVFSSDAKGFNTHTFWYDDGKEITVIDTQFVPQLARKAIDHIKSHSKNPITRVIITHPNPDKFNGLSALHAEGAISISSKATSDALLDVHNYKKYYFVNIAKKFTEKTYPRFEKINQTFEKEKRITLKSGETITLIELENPGISSTQTVVRIDATGDLLVGDLIHHKAHAWLEGGIIKGKPQPNLGKWRASLDELLKINNVKKVYGGRGEFTTLETAVKDQKTYLSVVETLSQTYLNGLGDKKAELLDPKTAGQHHVVLQKLMEKAFPDYKLSYMIKYGSYGLLQKIASGS